MHTAALDAYAGAYWVDAVVETLYCHLGALAWYAGNLADSNETIGYLRHFCLHQALEEEVGGAGEDNLWIVVLVGHTVDDGTDAFVLAIYVVRYLTRLWQQ